MDRKTALPLVVKLFVEWVWCVTSLMISSQGLGLGQSDKEALDRTARNAVEALNHYVELPGGLDE